MKPHIVILAALLLTGVSACRAQSTNLGSIHLSTPVVTNEQDLVALGALAASGTTWRAEWQQVAGAAAGSSAEVVRAALGGYSPLPPNSKDTVYAMKNRAWTAIRSQTETMSDVANYVAGLYPLWRAEWQTPGDRIVQPDTNAWVTVSNAVATLWRVERGATGGKLEVVATGGDGYVGPPVGSIFSNRVDVPEHSEWICGTEWQVWLDTDEGVPIWKVVHLAPDWHQWRYGGLALPGVLEPYTGTGWLTLHWAMGTNSYPLACMADLPDLTPYYPRSNPDNFATEDKVNDICYALIEEVHVAAGDPHGDRAYAQAQIAATALLPNALTGTDPLGTVVLNGQVTAVGHARPWEHTTTNEIAYGFYAIGSPGTSLVVRINEAQTLTQIVARCDIGAATATVFSVSTWSNAWSTAKPVADVLVSTMPSLTDVSATLQANGGWAIAFTNGSAAVTNGTIQLRTVNL